MGNACCLLQPALVVLSTSTSNPYRGQGLHLGIKRHPTGRSEYFRRHTHFTNEYATQKGGATNTPAWRQTNAFAPPHQPAVPLNGPSISKFSAFSLGSSNDWGWDSNQLGGWCWHLRFPTYWKSQHVGAHNSTFRFSPELQTHGDSPRDLFQPRRVRSAAETLHCGHLAATTISSGAECLPMVVVGRSSEEQARGSKTVDKRQWKICETLGGRSVVFKRSGERLERFSKERPGRHRGGDCLADGSGWDEPRLAISRRLIQVGIEDQLCQAGGRACISSGGGVVGCLSRTNRKGKGASAPTRYAEG